MWKAILFFAVACYTPVAAGYRRFVLTDIPCCYDKLTAPSIGHLQSQSAELNLVRALTGGNYSKLVKPKTARNATAGSAKQTLISNNRTRLLPRPLIVQARLYFIRIQEVDEAHETFHSTVRFQLNWQDPALVWNPDDFDGLTTVIVPGGLLWQPDLQIVNSVGEMYELLQDPSFGYRLFSDGNVWYHPTGQVSTHCKFDLMFYPFDWQRCTIIIESVIYQESELNLILRLNESQPVSLGMYAENELWEIVPNGVGGISSTYQSGSNTRFTRVIFALVMKRKPGFFVMTVIVPTILLAVVTLFTYLVPIHYVDRTIQSVTVLLAVALFDVSISESMPKTSEHCLLTIYLTVILATSGLTVLASSLCLALVDPGEFIRAPYGLPDLFEIIFRRQHSKLDHGVESATTYPRLSYINSRHNSLNSTKEFSWQQEKTSAPLSNEPNCCDVPDQNSNNHRQDVTKLPSRTVTSGTPSSILGTNNRHHQHKEIVPRHANEPERHLSRSKKAWHAAYIINWAAFFISLLATVLVPIIEFAILPPSYPPEAIQDDGTASGHGRYYGKI